MQPESDRIKLIDFLDERAKEVKTKIDISKDRIQQAYGQGRLDEIKYIRSCLKDSAALDFKKEEQC